MNEEYVRNVLFKDNKPVIYDMKDEYSSIFKLKDTDGNIDKWKKYKDYKPEYENKNIDCDVCELAVYVYNKTWDFLAKANINGDRPVKQVNSYPLDLKKIKDLKVSYDGKELCYSDIYKFECIVKCVESYKYQLVKNNCDGTKEYYRGDTMTSFKNTYNQYKKHFESNEKIKDQIEKFAKLHNTLGNMIPIPSYFNSERSGKYARYDFWDLTMQQIKKYYKHPEDDKSLKQLLNSEGDNKEEKTSIKLCKQWLSYFTSWIDFVEKNYLQDFIQLSDDYELMKDEAGDYISMDFWSNHSYKIFELPLEPNKFYDYLRILNVIIKKRNDRILIELYNNFKFKHQR